MARIPDLDAHLTPELRERSRAMMLARGLPAPGFSQGFYAQLMAYPELFEHLHALGAFVRFESALPPRVREAEVLMAAVEQGSAFEWQTHVTSSSAAGVGDDLRAAIASGASLQPFGDALEDVRVTVRCVVRQQSVPQDVFERLMQAFGVREAVEVVTLAAMYRMYASLAAAFDSTLPGAAPPPW